MKNDREWEQCFVLQFFFFHKRLDYENKMCFISRKVRLEVYNEERQEDIYNVIGTIKGKHEPGK